MRQLFLSLLLFAASPALAQTLYAEQQYQPPQTAYPQQQISDNYSPAVPAYNQPQYQPQQYQPAAPARELTPVGNPDAGQSVTQDIRQMNF